MNSILSMTAHERRMRRLVLGIAAGSALLLVAACGSDAEPSADAEASPDSTTVAGTTTDGQSTVASVETTPGSTDSTSSTTDADADSTTNAPTTTLTAVEQYLADANALLQAVDVTSDAVAAQLENADVESEVWRTETATTLRELAAVLDSAGDLAAPAEYTTQHQQLVDATSKYSWATEMLADGVETLDLTTISDAAALLANASVELATAQASLTS
jgi:hypothetical protein